jgi:hypothetical protein
MTWDSGAVFGEADGKADRGGAGMTELHHRRSIRLQGYDYGSAGAYFVTICAKNRECLFGDIVGGEMPLFRHGDRQTNDATPCRKSYAGSKRFRRAMSTSCAARRAFPSGSATTTSTSFATKIRSIASDTTS